MISGSEESLDTMKCAATDTTCLNEAKQLGKKVRIVEDNVLRCKVTDASCLKKAQTSGRPVEIID